MTLPLCREAYSENRPSDLRQAEVAADRVEAALVVEARAAGRPAELLLHARAGTAGEDPAERRVARAAAQAEGEVTAGRGLPCQALARPVAARIARVEQRPERRQGFVEEAARGDVRIAGRIGERVAERRVDGLVADVDHVDVDLFPALVPLLQLVDRLQDLHGRGG